MPFAKQEIYETRYPRKWTSTIFLYAFPYMLSAKFAFS